MGWDKFQKLTELIKRRITQIALYRLNDPRLGFLTITRVDLSRDLETCIVYYTVLGSDADISKTEHALKRATGFIQKEVAKTLRTRIMPRIQFKPDTELKKVNRMNELIGMIEAERPQPEEDPDDLSEDLRDPDKNMDE